MRCAVYWQSRPLQLENKVGICEISTVRPPALRLLAWSQCTHSRRLCAADGGPAFRSALGIGALMQTIVSNMRGVGPVRDEEV